MIGEKSNAHQYKLRSVVECGVMDVLAAMRLATSSYLKLSTKQTVQVWVHEDSLMDGFKVACVFDKDGFFRYMSNMCGLRLS